MEAHTAEAKEAEDEDRLPVSACEVIDEISINTLQRFELPSGPRCSQTYSFQAFNVRYHPTEDPLSLKCFLLVYAAITSGSLSLLATCIDSVFDPGSNLVLYWLHKKAGRLDTNKWPVGGSRLETIGNISYGVCFISLHSSQFTQMPPLNTGAL